ncbi:MAG: hypothetical protein WA734_20130, partial [Candidatus Acidiferrales bacterium]
FDVGAEEEFGGGEEGWRGGRWRVEDEEIEEDGVGGELEIAARRDKAAGLPASPTQNNDYEPCAAQR